MHIYIYLLIELSEDDVISKYCEYFAANNNSSSNSSLVCASLLLIPPNPTRNKFELGEHHHNHCQLSFIFIYIYIYFFLEVDYCSPRFCLPRSTWTRCYTNKKKIEIHTDRLACMHACLGLAAEIVMHVWMDGLPVWLTDWLVCLQFWLPQTSINDESNRPRVAFVSFCFFLPLCFLEKKIQLHRHRQWRHPRNPAYHSLYI